MIEYHPAIRKDQIPRGRGIAVDVAGQSIAIFRLQDGYYAIDNRCLHQGGPLADGDLEGSVVICPWHRWRFNVTTGRNDFDPGIRVRAYPVRVRGEEVLVGIEPRPTG